MGKFIVILLLLLGVIFMFFRGATRLIYALTGYKKSKSKNNSENQNHSVKRDDDVIYENGETKVFKGLAGNKKKENKL